MDYLISMFIDDEMDVDEKITFIEAVEKDKFFTNETLELLRQEKLICSKIVDRIPAVEVKPQHDWKRFLQPFLQPMGMAASVLAAAVIFLAIFMTRPTPGPAAYRFVIYRPDVSQVEITGTFTDWKRIPMRKVGASGYWETSLDIAEGEHRFTYILEGRQAIADPTIPAREFDDLGGENSIFHVERRA